MSMCHLMRLVRIVTLLQLVDLLYDCFAGPSERFFCVMLFSYMCFLIVHQNVLPSTCLQYGVTSYCRMLTCCCLRDASFCCLFILLLFVVVRISVIYTVYTSGLFMCLT